MLKVFCDFDGTVSKGDVGDAFFRRFSGEEALELVRRWEAGEMNSRDLYLAMLKSFRASPEEVEEFIAEQEIDPSFREFAGFCAREEIPLAILSDGMDLYIRPLLERNGLAGLSVYSNEMRWEQGHGWVIEFPYIEHACSRCANCKGYHLRRLRRKGDRLIFVGDGLSDLCAVKEADKVFAKGELAKFCQDHGIDFEPFQDFRDVLRGIRAEVKRHLLTKTHLRI